MTDDQIRAAFEVSFLKLHPTVTNRDYWFRRYGDGPYRDSGVDDRWRMWCAAWTNATAIAYEKIIALEAELADYRARRPTFLED